MTKNQKIEELLSRGVEEVIDREHLRKRLVTGEKLRIKFGVDPTRPDIHLGHAVTLRKLKKFQELGHRIIFIIGDFTAQIGDPSGRMDARIPLTLKEVSRNAKTYLKQVEKNLDIKKTEIVRNNEFLSKMSFAELFRLSQFFTVNQMMERGMFQKRKEKEKPIWLHEFLYPVLQAHDSVETKADVEIGGNDQLFNMLAGRILQPYFKQKPQDIIATKLLVGTDGKQKMSKALGNYIGITEGPREQYGKIMSISDALIESYFELCTDVALDEIRNLPPRDAKAKLAMEIVKIYHGKKAAAAAEEEFNRVFKKKGLPSQIPAISIKEKNMNILDLLVKAKLASSKSEAKRLVGQGGVEIGGEVKKDWRERIEIRRRQIIRAGKRKFVKII